MTNNGNGAQSKSARRRARRKAKRAQAGAVSQNGGTNKGPRRIAQAAARPPPRSGPPVMQRAIQAINGRAKQEFELVAVSLAMPTANYPVRWSSQFSTKKTATAAPWSQVNNPWAAGATSAFRNNDFDFTSEDAFCAVYRAAERAAVMFDPNIDNTTYQYKLFGRTATSTPAAEFTVGNSPDDIRINFLTPYAVSLAPQDYSPHGDILFGGATEGSEGRFFWCNSDVVWTFTFTPSFTGFIELGLDLWIDGKLSPASRFIREATVSATPQTETITLTVPGYYSPFYMFSSASPGTTENLSAVSIVIEGDQEVMRHLSIKDYDANLPSVQGIRINAVSVMYTNTAAPLSRQGSIVALQAPQQMQWTDFAGDFDAIVSAQDSSRQRDITNGLYTFLKPTQPDDFNIQDNLDTDGLIIQDSHWPLNNMSGFLIMAAKVVSSADAQKGVWTISHGVEFQTEDVWREVATSTVDRRVFDEALDYLKQIPQFHENPLHFKEIMGKIISGGRAIINGIEKYGPAIYSGIKKYGPTVLGAAAMLA